MNLLKRLFISISSNFKKSYKSYPLCIIYTIIASLYASYLVIIEPSKEFYIYILLALFVGIIGSLLFYLFNINKKLNVLISFILCITSYLALDLLLEEYNILIFFGIVLIILSNILFRLLNNNDKKYFAYLISNMFYVFLLCTILMIGTSVVIGAFYYLIYSFNDLYKLFLIAAIVIYLFIGISLYLSYIELNKDELNIPMQYHTIVHVAALLVYYLLLTVLYIYIIKIIITRTMPIGRLNWYASFALLFFIIFYLSGAYENDGLISFNHKYGGILLIPIFIIQTYAIYIRVSAYGLTTLRYISILFNIIGLSFVIASIIKNNRYLNLIVSIVIVIACFGPTNVIDVPIKNQEIILKETLIKNKMFDDYSVIPNNNLNNEDKEIIISTYEYLNGTNSKFNFKNKEFKEIFGFEKENDYFNCMYNLIDLVIDIKDYQTIEVLDGDSENKYILNIDINDLINTLYDTYEYIDTISYTNDKVLPIIDIDENTRIIFDSLYAVSNNNQIEYVSYHGYKLMK